jgi:molecular chaperone HtpG
MENHLNYSSEVRKKILSMLMFQLYSNEKTIYREYVQNALDSINKAIEARVLNQPKDGVVTIDIDAKHKVIKIKDNGAGIEAANAVRTLLDISPSTKDGVSYAGMYGIGRLVGGGYCHELIFRTSARGEAIGTQITFDVDKIWKMVETDKEDYLATDVINACTKRETFSTDESDHFFEVELNGVKDDAAPSLLDSEAICNYLREVAPVEYKPEFKNTLMYKSTADNPEFKTLHESLEKVQVFVGETRIQKQYGLSIKGTKDKISNLEYFKIEDKTYGLLGWGWYALTKYTIQIPKDDKLAGIRLRSHNIQIGDANLLSGTNYWKEDRSNSYFYGEFFVTHKHIRPNGARDGLVPTPESRALENGLRLYFENLKTLYTKANEAKKSIDKIYDGIKRIEEHGGAIDYNAKDLINNRGIGKFEKLLKSAGFEATKRMLLLYQPDFLAAKAKGEEMLRPTTAPQQESTLQKATPAKEEPVFDSSVNVEPTTATSPSAATETHIDFPTSPAADNTMVSSPSTDNQQVPVSVQEPATYQHEALLPSQRIVTPTSTPLLGQQDIIAPLNNVLDPSEIWLLRRVFKVLNSFCPDNEHDQNLIAEMERLIVKEFNDEI